MLRGKRRQEKGGETAETKKMHTDVQVFICSVDLLVWFMILLYLWWLVGGSFKSYYITFYNSILNFAECQMNEWSCIINLNLMKCNTCCLYLALEGCHCHRTSISFLSKSGSRGGYSPSYLSMGERWDTPWTGRQSIRGLTQRDRQLDLAPV